MAPSRKSEISVEYDDTLKSYYVIYELAVVGLGKTKQSALKDLRSAAHFGIDTTIDSQLKTFDIEKEV
jgi:hypothetical protein